MVERCINRLKQWRGLATRYEKRAVNYRAMVVIASIVIWLELCGVRPVENSRALDLAGVELSCYTARDDARRQEGVMGSHVA